MGEILLILVFSTCLAALIALVPTALRGIFTGHLYYEPNYPPIGIRDQPARFLARLAFYLAAISVLLIGCFQIGKVLF